jgi:dihydrolipoamide dehydrogenase
MLSGPGGCAAFRSADLGMKTVLVERWRRSAASTSTSAASRRRRCCTAAVVDETKLAAHGIASANPRSTLDWLRAWKDKVVGKLTGGLSGMAKARKVEVVRGVGQFLDPHHVEVEVTEGAGRARPARKSRQVREAIIAVGSRWCACHSSPTTRASSTRPAPT